MLEIKIPLEPTGQMRARHTSKGRTHKHATQQSRENKLLGYIMEQRPLRPLQGPLRLFLTASMPIPASWSQTRRIAAIAGVELPAKKPDLSNIIKQIEDVGNGILWEDDRQIVQIEAEKKYSIDPGWFLIVERMTGLE